MNSKLRSQKDIESEIRKLELVSSSSEFRNSLEKLGKTAKEGVSVKRWIRRLFFGFSLAEAIESWLDAFSPKIGAPLRDQIPREETNDVVAAWMAFSLRRALMLLVLSSAITLLTALFLYLQIKKQDLLINEQRAATELQREINAENKKLSYLKVLYDDDCESEVCTPRYNHRERAEALKGFVNLVGDNADLSFALLQGTKLLGFDFKNANLTEANLTNSRLDGALIADATLWKANLANASIHGIEIECLLLQMSDNWQTAYRDKSLKCDDPNYNETRRINEQVGGLFESFNEAIENTLNK